MRYAAWLINLKHDLIHRLVEAAGETDCLSLLCKQRRDQTRCCSFGLGRHRLPEIKVTAFLGLMHALCYLLSICLPNALDNLFYSPL